MRGVGSRGTPLSPCGRSLPGTSLRSCVFTPHCGWEWSSITEPSPGSWETHGIAEQRSALLHSECGVPGFLPSGGAGTHSQAGGSSGRPAQGTPPAQLFRQRASCDLPGAPFPIRDRGQQEGDMTCARYFWREIVGRPFGIKCHVCRDP